MPKVRRCDDRLSASPRQGLAHMAFDRHLCERPESCMTRPVLPGKRHKRAFWSGSRRASRHAGDWPPFAQGSR